MNGSFVKSLLISLFLIGIASCELVVNVDLPEQEPKLTINALAAADTLLYVSASQSRTMLDPDGGGYYPPLSNVSIELFEGDQLVEHLLYNSQMEVYQSTVPMKAGASYTLKAVAPDLDPVVVSTAVPVKRVITKTHIEPQAKMVDGQSRARVTFEFDDAADELNAYKMLITVRDSVNGEYPVCFYTKDLSINGNVDGLEGEPEVEYCNAVTFSDQLFDGRRKQVEFFIPDAILSNGFTKGITIYLIHLNRDMYLYERSSLLQQQTEGNPFAEPVFVYNNVEGGFGIFGAFNVTRQEVDF